MQRFPNAYGLGRKPAVGERDNKAPAGLEDTSDFGENLQWLGKVFDQGNRTRTS